MKPADYLVLAVLAVAGMVVWLWRRPGTRAGRPEDLSGKAEKAWKHLKEQGYTFAGASPEIPVRMWVEGRLQETSVRGDLLVRRSGRRYLALTDRQLLRGRLNSLRARQQLMALMWAFRVHGLILYNPGSDSSREIRLWVPGPPRWLLPLLVGLALGLLLGYRAFGT